MRRLLGIATSTAMLGVTTLALLGPAPAGAQVDAKDADYKGYSTGTVVHADALQLGTLLGGSQAANAEIAFSGATVASKGTDGVPGFGPGAASGTIVNEVNQVVQPNLPEAVPPGDRSYGRGSALEVGLLTPLPDATNTLMLSGKAQASAPPDSELVDRSITVPVNPVAYASLLRGQAQARFDATGRCILGEPLSFGRGFAADAQLLNTGAVLPGGVFEKPLAATDAPNPERAVSQSQSITRLVPQVNINGELIGTNFGLMTETRMTIAPITLFKNTPSQLTIEFLGEWVLRAVATGLPGQAYMFYGPGRTSATNNQTPVLRVLQGTDPNLPPVVNITLQQILGQPGTNGLGDTVNGLLATALTPLGIEVKVAEGPRKIGDYTGGAATEGGDGTVASGALDVVRVRVLDGSKLLGLSLPVASILDVRIGHMESRAQVPAGGIKCSLPVQKTSDKALVSAGETFTYSIKVDNPFADCDLTDVRVEDTISVESGVLYSVTGTEPTANSVSNTKIIWNDIGPIPPRTSKIVKVTVVVAGNSGSGLFTDNAKATGNCATGSAQGSAKIVVPVTGEVTVVVPRAGGPAPNELNARGGAAPETLPRTGGDPMVPMVGLVLLAFAAGLRRLAVSR